jgi:hypothetical protein
MEDAGERWSVLNPLASEPHDRPCSAIRSHASQCASRRRHGLVYRNSRVTSLSHHGIHHSPTHARLITCDGPITHDISSPKRLRRRRVTAAAAVQSISLEGLNRVRPARLVPLAKIYTLSTLFPAFDVYSVIYPTPLLLAAHCPPI